jgi:Glyoxalase-like domain
VITEIDHIIVAVDRNEHPAMASTLRSNGFEHGDAGRHPGGTANENMAYATGAFLELLYEQETGSGPDVWFKETPRIQGLGFATTDYERSVAAFRDLPAAWDRDFAKTLSNGDQVSVRAAGPLPLEEFYPFLMDRPAPTFGDRGATALLREVTFAGEEHALWRERMRSWFGLPERGEALSAGDVLLTFRRGPHPRIRLSLAFDVEGEGGAIPLAGGTILLNPV